LGTLPACRRGDGAPRLVRGQEGRHLVGDRQAPLWHRGALPRHLRGQSRPTQKRSGLDPALPAPLSATPTPRRGAALASGGWEASAVRCSATCLLAGDMPSKRPVTASKAGPMQRVVMGTVSQAVGAARPAERDSRSAQRLRVLRALAPYVWPSERPDLQATVIVSLLLMLVAKIITVTMP